MEQRLIQAGASLETRDDDGETALHDAAELGDTKMVEFLLDSGRMCPMHMLISEHKERTYL